MAAARLLGNRPVCIGCSLGDVCGGLLGVLPFKCDLDAGDAIVASYIWAVFSGL